MSTIIKINDQRLLLWKSYRKLILFSLPQLHQIQRYYIDVNFISCAADNVIMVASKNTLKFLKPSILPLRFVEFKQQFLQLEPIGGVCLSNAVVLYLPHSIAFYDRSRNFSKSWAITVIQQIVRIQSSQNQKYIGMEVKECNNTIYMWHMQSLSSNPNQEIQVSDNIVQWEFTKDSTLTILSTRQFRIYLPTSNGNHYLHYCIELSEVADLKGFCWMDSSLEPNLHDSRRSVDTIAVLNSKGKLFVYELFELMKRVKSSTYALVGEIENNKNVEKLVRGWSTEGQINLAGEKDRGKPFVWGLTFKQNKFLIQKKFVYKQELGQNIKSVQCKYPIIAVNSEEKTQILKLIKNSSYQKLRDIQGNKGILTKQFYISIREDKWVVSYHLEEKQFEMQAKEKQEMKLLCQNETDVFLVGGIKVYKLADKKLLTAGFIIRNPNFKLQEVNTFTQSLLYKVNEEYVLMEYSLKDQKIITKTVRSSTNRMISLRDNRWAELNSSQIKVGIENSILATFNLKKMYKTLLNENVVFDYDLYWTTHRGMILTIKNYLFILQLLEGSEGYTLSLLKRGHNYLYKRFSAYCPKINILDPRQLIVGIKNRVIRLGNRLGQLVFEDPYSLPQTILQRQLLMRKFYPPHHPKILDLLISCSQYNLAKLILIKTYEAILQNKDINYLYSIMGSTFFIEYSLKSIEELTKIQAEISNKEEILRKLSALILEEPQKIMLEETGPLLIENQIQSLVFQSQNVRSMDYFSSAVMTQMQIIAYKSCSFDTRHIAFMIHSINKDQAINFLKPQKIKWDWMKKYSIPLWYSNIEVIKKWVEQIAMNEYRQDKQPLNCLLWYLLINKKSLLITLFKSNQHNSKQHASIFTFLQRDFSQPANLSAASKNAYVLMDKKRYQHAIAFFLLGNKYQQCISLCLSRLNDISLAYTICLLFNLDKNKVLDSLDNNGDTWCHHISYFLRDKHIDSYNCLFKDDNMDSWELEIPKCGYHPSIIKFAQNVQSSVQVKRQLQEQEMSQQVPADLLDYFSEKPNLEIHKSQEQKLKQSLQPNKKLHIMKAIRFYLQNSAPCLGLMFDKDHRQCLRASSLQQMMFTGRITNDMQEIVEDMQDVVGLISKCIQTNSTDKIIHQITKFCEQFKQCFLTVNLTIVYPSFKENIGSMLYHCFRGQKIIKLIENHPLANYPIMKDIKQLCNISKILISLQMKIYSDIDELLEFKKQYKYADETFWQKLKSQYNKIPFECKVKSNQLMDCFEPSFYKFARRQRQENVKDINVDLKLELQPSAILLLNQMAVKYVAKKAETFSDIMTQKRNQLTLMIKRWVDNDLKNEIKKDYNIIIRDGINCRLKLSLISNMFGQDFQSVGKMVCKIFQEKQELANFKFLLSEGQKTQKSQRQAVQVFRNKQDGVRSFAINKNEGAGMEIVVLFKKGLKKVEICQSLSQRNRSQDGYSLIHQDQFYNTNSNLKVENLLENPHPNAFLHQKITEIINNRRSYDGVGLIRNSAKKGDNDYFKPADPIPYMDHNQLNSIQCHYYLPLILIGGKGLIDIANFSNLKNFNRIQCPNMGQLVKLWSFQNRVTALDSSGNISSYNFDSKYTNNCVYSLRKSNILDFCPLNPSTLALLSNNSLQVFDTLLHPKRQNIFKIKFTNQPISVRALNDMKLVVLKKSQILIYDVRMDRLESTKDIESEGKSLCTNYSNKILVGRSDSKIRIFDIKNDTDEIIKIGRVTCNSVNILEKKNNIELISLMGTCVLFLTTEGSIYLIDKI